MLPRRNQDVERPLNMIFPFRGLARSDPAGTLPASGSAVIIRRTSSFHVVEIIIERISNRPVVVPGDSMRVCGRSFAVVLFFLFASARLKLFFCLATVVRNLSGAVEFHSPPRFFFRPRPRPPPRYCASSHAAGRSGGAFFTPVV